MGLYGLVGGAGGAIFSPIYFGLEAFYPGGTTQALLDKAMRDAQISKIMGTSFNSINQGLTVRLNGNSETNVYYYIFYKIYNLLERSSLPWWSDFKASFLLAAIEMIILALVEYKMVIWLSVQGADIFGKLGYILIIGGLPLVLNYFLFMYCNRWKYIVEYFESADKLQKRKLNFQMTISLLFVVGLIAFLLWV